MEEVNEVATYTWASATVKCLPDFANRPSGDFSLCVDPQGLEFPKESPRISRSNSFAIWAKS